MTLKQSELNAWLDERFGGASQPLAAAVVTADGSVTTVRNADPDAEFEIGSISKGLTGLLYADSADRGEVTPTTRLGELLPLGTAPAAALTLGSLSTHRSGLPRLPPGMHPWRGTWALWTRGANPYGHTLEELLEQTRRVKVGQPRPAYSNLGFQLLGHAVAAAAGTSYAELLATRLTGPLGLTGFSVPASPAELGARTVQGRTRRGRAAEAWTGEAVGPAGGIRATVDGMAGLARALLVGEAPGLLALEPVARLGAGARIGAGWVVIESKGRRVVWHNGGTGGFRTWLGMGGGVGALVLSARAMSVDRAGFTLLAAADGRSQEAG